jgi:hypothetical protein
MHMLLNGMIIMSSMDFKDFEKFTLDFKNTDKETKKLADEFLELQADKFLNIVRPRTPSKSGTLRKEWFKAKGLRKKRIINPMEYASYVEYGTKNEDGSERMEPRYMMTQTEYDVEREMKGDWEQFWKSKNK